MDQVRPRHLAFLILFLVLAAVGIVLWRSELDLHSFAAALDHTFFWFLLAGFAAQLVDGALGMAYGVTSNSLLLYSGLSPKLASAAVHTAEVFTTAATGLSHLRFGNVDMKLFFALLLPGVAGAAVGAYLLGAVIDGGFIRPYINAYLLLLGGLILFKAFRPPAAANDSLRFAGAYALCGGLLDAIGGGGWGPIVTSNLIHRGRTPRLVIGTVNTVEFFVTLTTAGILIFFTGLRSWPVVLGLVAGGMLAAPLGAYATRVLPRKALLILVGSLIMGVSLFSLFG